MKVFGAAVVIGLVIPARSACPPAGFDSIADLDFDAFVSKRWYIQQQMVTSYLPTSQNWCVFAEYHRRAQKTALGYDIDVHNHAEERDGTVHDSDQNNLFFGLKAKIVDARRGRLEVAPWFVPPSLSGPYWVIAYSGAEGYSLVSGGPPTEDGEGGKCRTGSGTNKAGLWIFTTARERDDKLLAKVRDIASAKGFDVSVLNDIDQSNCTTQRRPLEEVLAV